MFPKFCFYSSHLLAAREFWERIVQKNDQVIDATCGNGQDTVFLASLVPEGRLIGFDIQQEAIEKTKERIGKERLTAKVEISLRSHATFPEDIVKESIRLIVYNLGYLPGGNKQLTTLTETTLQSLKNALSLIMPGGALSITLYAGHPEGEREKAALLSWSQGLPSSLWMSLHVEWQNRGKAPSLLFICKRD